MEPPQSRKRKCSTANWSDLPQDLVVHTAKQFLSIYDFKAFGGVCKTWSCAATEENFTGGLTHQVPLLMLRGSSEDGITSTANRECYNLVKGKLCRLGTNIQLRPLKWWPLLGCWCLSSLGWLLAQSITDPRVTYLLHPFKHREIVLPTFSEYPNRLDKFVLSSSPSLTSDFVVMVLLRCPRYLAFCRPKVDNAWTKVSLEHPNVLSLSGPSDIAYYKGQFYFMNYSSGDILVCDIDDTKKPKIRDDVVPYMPHNAKLFLLRNNYVKQMYLVESAGDLLVVLRLNSKFDVRKTTGIRVFKVPFSTGNWYDSEVKNLGNRALFLGENNSSFSNEALAYGSGCMANCIYFQTDEEETKLGIYSMKYGEFKPFLPKFPKLKKPYVWIQPSF